MDGWDKRVDVCVDGGMGRVSTCVPDRLDMKVDTAQTGTHMTTPERSKIVWGHDIS